MRAPAILHLDTHAQFRGLRGFLLALSDICAKGNSGLKNEFLSDPITVGPGAPHVGADLGLRCVVEALYGSVTLPERRHVPPIRAGARPQDVLCTRCSRRQRGYH